VNLAWLRPPPPRLKNERKIIVRDFVHDTPEFLAKRKIRIKSLIPPGANVIKLVLSVIYEFS
jgi:hypothetical protein